MGLFVNQAEREYWELAEIDGEILIEYEMPAGTTALRIWRVGTDINLSRSVSYHNVPVKWLRAMVANGVERSGLGQRIVMQRGRRLDTSRVRTVKQELESRGG